MTEKQSTSQSPGRVSAWVVVPWLVLLGVTVFGADYYFADLGTRVRHARADWFKPSGLIGQTAGLLTFAGFLFLWLYPMRKKLGPAASWLGRVPAWLDVHIVVGLTLPILGAVHAGWRFDGIIGVGYWAMLIVALSGVVGRYVYVHIPRNRSGLELDAEDLAQQRRQLLIQLTEVTGLESEVVQSTLAAEPVSDARLGLLPSLWRMVKDDWRRRRAGHELRKKWEAIEGAEVDPRKLREVVRLARRQMALSQQARLLGQSQRVFRHWHTFHRPFAMTALLAVTIHVVVVVWTGVTWLY
jgi:hypothetical protein